MGDNDDVFYPRLLGAIFPEAVRQVQEERDRRRQRWQEAFDAYIFGWDRGRGDPPVGVIRPPAPASPLPSWRSRTPAEVAEYDRRFLHVLGITPL